MSARKLKLFISMTLDGYIATKDDKLDFLSLVEEEGEDYGYTDFVSSVDTYIIGRKTYEVIKGLLGGDFPQAREYDCYVITRQNLKDEDGVTFYNGDLPELVNQLKAKPGKNIYCDGGAEIVRILLEAELIDEFIISIIPILLGEGKRLFLENDVFQQLDLIGTKAFPKGLVQLHYTKK